jgi:DNA-binding ferritin-like protein
MIETLVSHIFALRNLAHLAHWATGNYSAHVALGEFYDEIVAKVDQIVEIYQGRNALIGPVPPLVFSDDDIISRIREEMDWLSANRAAIAAGDEVIGNQLDELGAIFGRTLYKLRFLS